MYKLIKNVSLIVFILIVVSSCTKDNVVSNDNNLVTCAFNPTEDYPFVLPEAMQPYQFAIYEDDLSGLFDYMQTVFENYSDGEEGYFSLSLNATGGLIYYGFITGTSIYYDPSIWIVPDSLFDPNDNGGYEYSETRYKTDDYKDAMAWAKKEVDAGYKVRVAYNKDVKTYIVTSSRP